VTDDAKCCECNRAVSYETGFTLTGGLGDNSQDRLYCPECAPDQGKGYTIADLEQMREENQAARARYQLSQMDRIGPDVYFAMKGDE
jgi:hypothetical protein